MRSLRGPTFSIAVGLWVLAGWVLGVCATCALGCAVRMETVDASLGLDVQVGDTGPRPGTCTRDLDCVDRIACSIDHCTSGACTHEPCPDCCPGALVCDPGLGCGPAPEPCTTDAECRDDVPCTIDRCRDRTACEHVPEPALCSAGEICLGGVGCVAEPPASCTTDADCASSNRCAAVWRCEPEFGCAFVSPLDCDDGDACTTDRCEAATGCAHAPRDDDGDGFVADTCGGEDCDDTLESVSPGATELCGDGVDQDCDTRIDEGCCTSGASCTTTCGTTGTTACAMDGTSSCTPPPETCNGIDDDCDGMRDEACCMAGAACTTTCGTTGTTACAPDGTSSCAPPAETCNDVDDDCDGAIDDGFACRVGASTACMTACGSTGSRMCLPGCALDATCVPPAETCNGVDDDCDASCDDGFTCCAGSTRACNAFGFFSGTALCRGDCSGFDTSTCSNCGNGTRNMGEACDGADLGGASCTSLGMGYAGGTLRCAAGCAFDTSSCTRCGNGTIDSGEQCDGATLGGATCASIGMGFAGGTLSCGPSCTYVTSGCTRCGNGTIDGGEQCDGANLGGASCTTIPGGYTGGTLACTAGCAFNTSMCIAWNPSGTYSITPGVAYMCADSGWLGYLVDFSFSSVGFADDGSTMTVTGTGLPCAPTGPSPRSSPTRAFNLACTASGSCNETYRFAGMFTSDNAWTATFTASYSGSCLDCTMQSRAISGSR
ncbi:MAG: putative metal-binding motif-containing protein [Sandaracinus sp.]